MMLRFGIYGEGGWNKDAAKTPPLLPLKHAHNMPSQIRRLNGTGIPAHHCASLRIAVKAGP